MSLALREEDVVSLLKNYNEIVLKLAHNYCDTYKNNLETLISIGQEAMIIAHKTYKPQKALFTTYAFTCIRNAMIKYVKRESSKTKRNIPLFDVSERDIATSNDSPEYISLDECVEMKELIEKMATKKEYKILKLRLSGYSWSEISKIIKTSKENSSRIFYDFRNRLKERLNENFGGVY